MYLIEMLQMIITTNGPVHEILVLTAYASSEGSNQLAQSSQSLPCLHLESLDINEGSG